MRSQQGRRGREEALHQHFVAAPVSGDEDGYIILDCSALGFEVCSLNAVDCVQGCRNISDLRRVASCAGVQRGDGLFSVNGGADFGGRAAVFLPIKIYIVPQHIVIRNAETYR
jgi:hypothetical protein